jgi:hypothetical protein
MKIRIGNEILTVVMRSQHIEHLYRSVGVDWGLITDWVRGGLLTDVELARLRSMIRTVNSYPVDISGMTKIKVIKIIRAATDCDLKSAKDLAELLFVFDEHGVSYSEDPEINRFNRFCYEVFPSFVHDLIRWVGFVLVRRTDEETGRVLGYEWYSKAAYMKLRDER